MLYLQSTSPSASVTTSLKLLQIVEIICIQSQEKIQKLSLFPINLILLLDRAAWKHIIYLKLY